MTAPPVDHATEQARAEAELAGDDWPDHDTRRHMLRRGRWKPIDVLPDISNYQPAQGKAPGQN